MGKLASKVKGDSPRLPSCHPWSRAPSGSWVIRFSPGGPATQKFHKLTEIKGLPLYHWSSPDWVTGDNFNTLMFVVVQIFLEGNHNRLTRLMEEPLQAAEMIAQFNTFINSTNQDMRELQNQLFEAAHESIYLHIEDDQLRYLDLLITNEFDPQYEVRAVINRKIRSSKSSLLRSVTTTIKSKLARKKNKGHQASHPAQQSVSVPSHDLPNEDHTQLRPTAPWLSELNERTETVTTRDDVDNTDEFCVPGVSDNSNSTKDSDRESFKIGSRNAESTRKLEDKSLDIELNMPSSSLSLPSTSQTVTSLSAVVAFEQSPDELIAKQKGVSCMKVSPEASNAIYSSFTVDTEDDIMLQSKENNENEKNAGSDSCAQEDASEDADVFGYVSDSVVFSHLQTWHAEAEEPDSSNSDPIYGDVLSGSICAESVEHSKDNGLAFSDVPFGSSENREDNGQVCVNVPSGPKHAESVEYRNDHGQVHCDVPSGPKLASAESIEYRNDNGPPCTDVSSGLGHVEPFECTKEYGPLSTASPSVSKKGNITDNGLTSSTVPSGLKQAESSELNKDNGPNNSDASSGSEQAESSELNKDNGPNNSDAPSGSEQAESSEHGLENDPACADRPPGAMHVEPNEEKDNNGPVCIDVPTGTTLSNSSEHHSNDDPVNVMAPPKKHSSSPYTFLPIYGLSKSCLRSTTKSVSTVTQERSANVKQEKEEHGTKPQVHEPSSSSFVCLPFHGLSRGSFSPPQQGVSTRAQSQKRKADIDKAYNDAKLVAKRLKLDDTSYRAEGNNDPCYSNPKGADCQSDTEMTNPRSMTHQVNTDSQEICANVKEEKEEPVTKPRVHKPSPSSYVCIPIHGLSRGSFSPPQQGVSTRVQIQKRKADADEANGVKLVAKRLKLDDTFCEAGEGENSDPCHSSAEIADCQSNTDMTNPRCNIVDDTEGDDGNDSSSSESTEWHDALEDVEP